MIEAKNKLKEAAEKALAHLDNQMSKVRTGRATAAMFDGIKVDYYGTPTEIAQASSISIPEPRQIVIKPYDRELVQHILAALNATNRGFNPQDEGDKIRIKIPQITEEVRKGLVKDLSKYEEEAKIGIRNGRKEANDIIKKSELSDDMKKSAQDEVQKLTDELISTVEDKIKLKADDLMKV